MREKTGAPPGVAITVLGSFFFLLTCCGSCSLFGFLYGLLTDELDRPRPQLSERISVEIGSGRESDVRVWVEDDFASLSLPRNPSRISSFGNQSLGSFHTIPNRWIVSIPQSDLVYHMRVHQIHETEWRAGPSRNAWGIFSMRVDSERRRGELESFSTTRIDGYPALEMVERPSPMQAPNSYTHEMNVIIGNTHVTVYTTSSRVALPTRESRRVLNSLQFSESALNAME